MALTAGNIFSKPARVIRDLVLLLLGTATGLAIIALGVWRFKYQFVHIHHHRLHGSFVYAVLALTGAEVIIAIGLIATAIAVSKGLKRLQRNS